MLWPCLLTRPSRGLALRVPGPSRRFDRKLKRDEWISLKRENPDLKWSDLLENTVTVDTVEAFWRVYLHLKRPAEIADGRNVYMFRAGQLPAWEEYPYGGCWILKFKRHVAGKGAAAGGKAARTDAGRVWQSMLLALVGEACLDTDVVGASLAVRPKEYLVSLWNRDNRDESKRFRIADRLKTVLGLSPSSRIDYKYHVRSLMDRSTYVNAQSFVFVDSAEGGDDAGQSTTSSGSRGGRGRGRGGSHRGGSRGRGGAGRGRGGGGSSSGGARGREANSWRTKAAAKPAAQA